MPSLSSAFFFGNLRMHGSFEKSIVLQAIGMGSFLGNLLPAFLWHFGLLFPFKALLATLQFFRWSGGAILDWSWCMLMHGDIWCCHFVTADAGREMSDTCTEMYGINTTNKVQDIYGIVLNLQQKVLTHSPSTFVHHQHCSQYPFSNAWKILVVPFRRKQRNG